MRGIIKYLWAGIFLLTGFKTYSQVVDLNRIDDSDLSLFLSENRNSRNNEIKYADIKGSPYYTDDFQTADIYFKNGKMIKQVSVRLNLYSMTLEFMRGEEVLEMTRMEGLDHLKVGEEHFILVNEVYDSGDAGFYKIEVDGKYRLLQLLQVTYIDAKEAISSYEEDKPAEFKSNKEKYYLGVENEAPVAFGNKRNFKKVFGKNFPEFLQYANDNKINPTRFEDLVKMVQHFNSLK